MNDAERAGTVFAGVYSTVSIARICNSRFSIINPDMKKMDPVAQLLSRRRATTGAENGPHSARRCKNDGMAAALVNKSPSFFPALFFAVPSGCRDSGTQQHTNERAWLSDFGGRGQQCWQRKGKGTKRYVTFTHIDNNMS